MLLKYSYLIFFIFLFINPAHSQSASRHVSKAKKFYKKGNYTDASFEAIKALKIKPKKKSAQKILSLSYESAQENLFEEIEDLKSSSDIYSGDITVKFRERIVKLYKTLKKLDRKWNSISKLVKSKKYDLNFERIDIKENALKAKRLFTEANNQSAENHYLSALLLMKNENREDSKKAAKEFKKSQSFISDYKQSNTLYEEARIDGTTRIAIFAFDNKSNITKFGAIGESVSDKLSSALFNNKASMEFVEIVSRDELSRVIEEHNLNMTDDVNQNTISEYGKLMGVHVIVTGKITRVGAEHQNVINDSPRTVSREVVTGKESYVNSKGKTKTRSVYGLVYAQVFEHRKESKATLEGSYKVIDVKTARVLKQNQFNETYIWKNKWVTFTGDERAIGRGSYKGYDTNELNPPADFEMANILTQIIAKKMATKISVTLN